MTRSGTDERNNGREDRPGEERISFETNKSNTHQKSAFGSNRPTNSGERTKALRDKDERAAANSRVLPPSFRSVGARWGGFSRMFGGGLRPSVAHREFGGSSRLDRGMKPAVEGREERSGQLCRPTSQNSRSLLPAGGGHSRIDRRRKIITPHPPTFPSFSSPFTPLCRPPARSAVRPIDP